MKNRIPTRSLFAYYVFDFLTLGIYGLVFWTKLGKQTNIICEGDGKKTLHYMLCFLFNCITLGIFGLVWKFKLAERLHDNAERYDLRFSEGGGLVLFFSLVQFLPLAHFIIIKNFNKLVEAYNDYNGLVDPDADKRINFFSDDEDELAAEEAV